MSPRLPSILRPALGFALPDHGADDRSTPTDGPAEPFDRLLRLGATGLAATVWATADGVAVVHPSSRIGSRLRRSRIGSIEASQLPPSALRLAELVDLVSNQAHLSLALADRAGLDAVLSVIGPTSMTEQQLWLRHSDLAELTSWRSATSARLILTASGASSGGGVERQAANLEQRGLDGLLLPHQEWSGGKVAMMHRFGRLALGSGPVHEREIATLIDSGIDAVHTDQVARMMAVIVEYYGATS